MHPRNPYKDKPPDFNELAEKYSEFRSHCFIAPNGKVRIFLSYTDFKMGIRGWLICLVGSSGQCTFVCALISQIFCGSLEAYNEHNFVIIPLLV
uniref:Uncharacterized protein n=1 Tax=Parascaris equorum TaxID=6256 RepID=A0A914RJP6_PAREQ